MLAFAPCAIGVLATQRYFYSDVTQLFDQRLGFGEMAADIYFFTLEQDQQAGDEIALWNTPSTGVRGFAVTGGDGDRHETAGQLSPAQEVHDRPADTGCVHDQRRPVAQLGLETRRRTCSTMVG